MRTLLLIVVTSLINYMFMEGVFQMTVTVGIGICIMLLSDILTYVKCAYCGITSKNDRRRNNRKAPTCEKE